MALTFDLAETGCCSSLQNKIFFNCSALVTSFHSCCVCACQEFVSKTHKHKKYIKNSRIYFIDL